MNKVLSIPRELSRKGELVIMPRADYEKLLNISENQAELKEGISQSLKEIQKGKIAGPFKNSKDLIKSLLT